MPGSLATEVAAWRARLSAFEPGSYSGEDCAQLTEELAGLEKACAAVRVLAARRAVDCKAHESRGFHDGAAWLARHAGSNGSQARQALRTAEQLSACPDTKEALLGGHISLAQAAEITQAEADLPGAEAALLPEAQISDLTRLREQARQHIQARRDPAQLRAAQWAAREFRHWRDREGMVRFAGALPPETGLPFVRRIETAALRRRKAKRAAGSPAERFEAHAADALAELVAGSQSQPGRNAELVIVCDLLAWRRGHALPGEVCHIIDGGPIPVEVARELSEDAFLKAVLFSGTNIHTVKHFGRHIPAELRTALDLGPVPAFTGRQCSQCGSRWGLEYDHIDPVDHHGPTSYDNLQALCWPDHQAKTEQDRRAGLIGSQEPGPPDTS